MGGGRGGGKIMKITTANEGGGGVSGKIYCATTKILQSPPQAISNDQSLSQVTGVKG